MGHNDHLHTEPIGWVPDSRMGISSGTYVWDGGRWVEPVETPQASSDRKAGRGRSETPAERKQHPVASGLCDYFPQALMAVAHTSWVGNEQHNPGKHLFWDRSKSTDEADALMRHFLQRGTLDTDGIRHSAKIAWRALALLQKEIEAETIEENG